LQHRFEISYRWETVEGGGKRKKNNLGESLLGKKNEGTVITGVVLSVCFDVFEI